jgi:hypothetical protein
MQGGEAVSASDESFSFDFDHSFLGTCALCAINQVFFLT